MKNSSSQRYLQSLQYFSFFKSIKLEMYQPIAISFLMFMLVLSMALAVSRPITDKQHADLVQLAQQSMYPLTRTIAKELVAEQNINRYQYFRVLRAAYFEQRNVNQEDKIKVELQKSVHSTY